MYASGLYPDDISTMDYANQVVYFNSTNPMHIKNIWNRISQVNEGKM